MNEQNSLQKPDAWISLKQFTQARIAIGRTGVSINHRENLAFKLAHAHARDAVYTRLNSGSIHSALKTIGLSCLVLKTRATDRYQYLQRPGLGKELNESSALQLSGEPVPGYDIGITITDGLSAGAVNTHCLPVLEKLLPLFHSRQYSLAPVCLVEQGRVAVSDETGSFLKVNVSIIFIGERPGLSSADSLGVYITYAPAKGNTDGKRNCISNIRPFGLPYTDAAEKIFSVTTACLTKKISGVLLKE